MNIRSRIAGNGETGPVGRPKGARNKSTIERLERERLARENAANPKLAESHALAAATVMATHAKKLGKEILEDFALLFAGMAASYQPWPATAGKNPNENEAKFEKYAMLAVQAARDLAPYQSPRLAAVMVGQALVSKVEVVGGMPDDFQAPALPVEPDGKVQPIAPGTIITADEDGYSVPRPAGAAA